MQNEKLRELSLFSGAGGGLLASKYLLGWETLGYIEWEDYPQRVLAQRIKDGLLDEAPIFGDIRTFISEGYARRYRGVVDVVSGGFPCQDISYCNSHGEGVGGEKSGLWKEMAEVIRIVRPRKVYVENSAALTIRGLGTVLKDLAKMGFNAEWCCLSSSEIGGGHGRERIWIVADSTEIRLKHTVNAKSYGNNQQGQEKTLSVKRITPFNKKRFYEKICSSEFVRGNNEIPNRVDRVKAIGNAQDPIVAATAWNILRGNYAK